MSAPAAKKGMMRFLLLGDSITQFGNDVKQNGWTSQLTNHYIRRADIVNRGMSGYNTRWTREILQGDFTTKVCKLVPPQYDAGAHKTVPFDLVTLFLGANDAAISFQNVPLAEFKQNLLSIIDILVKSHHIRRLVLVTPGPIDDEVWLAEMVVKAKANGDETLPTESNRSNPVAMAYAAAVREVAKQAAEAHKGACNVCLADIITPMLELGGDEYKKCLCDGLHFSSLGNQITFDTVKGVIEDNFPEFVADAMPFDLPDYKAYEGRQPE